MKKIFKKNKKLLGLIFFYAITFFLINPCFSHESSDDVNRAWSLLGKGDFDEVFKLTNESIHKYTESADKLARNLKEIPHKGEESNYEIMNNVATCYFIKAEALEDVGKIEEAITILKEVIQKYPYAQSFDPRGWYWSIKEKAEVTICRLDDGCINQTVDIIDKDIFINLYDTGTEFPVNYLKYGKFENIGTKNYRYVISDPIGLATATGEGIYPNTTSVKFDPEFVEIKKMLQKVNHWEIFNSRDLKTAFYKWNIASEPPPVKLFYIAELLERSGHIKQAVKAYYAILVHFPNSYGWTYWQTPWYIGKAALYRIKVLIKNYPDLKLKFEGADIKIINGYDNSVRNDIFVTNPGELSKLTIWKKLRTKKRHKSTKIKRTIGEKIKLVNYANGDWKLFVNNKPFIIQGITYAPTRVGESPDKGTLANWTTQDLNENGIIDSAFESWVDKNRNNIQDPDEKIIGDFALLKEMGINTIRLYHQPDELNKSLIKKLYEDYGIYVMLGDFLGKYTLGSGAEWEKGTDYDNPVDKKNMLESVKKMVMEFKDEPGILMWLLGNENVYGLGCNADKKPESFFKFANEAALLIKELDPQKRPVAISSGDTLFLDIFAKNCPDIDIFGTNSYRGKYGFLDLWNEVKRVSGKAAMITEYGTSSHAKGYSEDEGEAYQSNYHKGCWDDIMSNSNGFGAGNALGGIAFEWIDEWWKAYEPFIHDKKGLFSGPFLDGYMHEEWLGITSQGNGKSSPYLRQLKKAYFTYKELWNLK